MAKSKQNPKVDFYFNKPNQWKEEMRKLRTIVLSMGLTEELKWGVPCYTLSGGNVVLIHGFKEYCALLFMKGALMKDPAKILIQQTKNVQQGRHIRFTDVGEIVEMEKTLKIYIQNAIEVEKSGVKFVHKSTEEFDVAEEFEARLTKDKTLKAAFEKLTPGRQRGYLLYFAAAKLATTREARIDKYAPMIMKGKGLND
jgi:uncharacterized protein YdeI (YjbR/CyaY-like superfamily)